MSTILTALNATTAVSCAVLGGSFFVFSSTVMPALGRLPDAEGLRAMQRINELAPRSLLMLPLAGAALVGAAAAITAGLDGTAPGRIAAIIGGACGLASGLITASYHVPRNNALGRMSDDATGLAAWRRYRPGWTRWNSARAAVAVAGAVASGMAALS
ncbi:DUF1772 domain-containing protein [Nakamurella sp. YIM 132087]|uniref:DUF1772 domain-containing protein n=1 Tax=Nakamurella alba TaxID=2665158 RepID=A0A7K1FJL8_9ACTN|nr:anthrone oxygenase family protein [Nakamurella alba]MTD14332.1 DUF1772 domain-containing protein [Nakamurella alba]